MNRTDRRTDGKGSLGTQQQEPPQKVSIRFLIIGSGRLARHLRHYLQTLELKNTVITEWDRSQDPHLLAEKIETSTHVLLAVSDHAIETVYRKYLEGHDKVVVHFSGALNISGVISAHPLMTFGPELYAIPFYQKIHFVVSGASSLQMALPGLSNSFSLLAEKDKAFYHALCVVGGNFTTLLVQKMILEFAELGIPSQAARLYVEKIVDNVFAHPHQALTGPLGRKDKQTVSKNLKALEADPYQKIYRSFVEVQWPEYFSEREKL